jgi:predicted PhzF superfamily epimerase YddE/YHI9
MMARIAYPYPLTSPASPRFPGRGGSAGLARRAGGHTALSPMPGQPFVQIDVTRESFGGNPAAVFLLPSGRDEGWMQRGDEFDLRWFTPTVEVELCGHATLASAHMLWESGVLPADTPARFQTRSGLLTARRQDERIWLELSARGRTLWIGLEGDRVQLGGHAVTVLRGELV